MTFITPRRDSRALHAELLLAALRCEALADRMDDTHFRAYLIDLTSQLDLPEPKPLTVLNGGRA